MKTQTTPPPIQRFRERFGYDNLVGIERERFEHQEQFLIQELEASRKEERAFIGEQKRKAYQMGYKEAQVASRKEVIMELADKETCFNPDCATCHNQDNVLQALGTEEPVKVANPRPLPAEEDHLEKEVIRAILKPKKPTEEQGKGKE